MKNRDFGQAVEALQSGKLVCREGWNGKGMYLFLVTDWGVIDAPAYNRVAEKDGDAEFAPFVCMRTAEAKLIPWLAPQTDVLATDWEIL